LASESKCKFFLFDAARVSACVEQHGYEVVVAHSRENVLMSTAADLDTRFQVPILKRKGEKGEEESGTAKRKDAPLHLNLDVWDNRPWDKLLEYYSTSKASKKTPTIFLVELSSVLDFGMPDSPEDMASSLKATFVQPLRKLRSQLHPKSQFIFVLLPAIHEFLWAHETMPRALAFNAVAKKVLQGSGWRILDAMLPTIPRPEFRSQRALMWANQTGAEGYALSNIFLNMVCNL
jgi:hypothetical protein